MLRTGSTTDRASCGTIHKISQHKEEEENSVFYIQLIWAHAMWVSPNHRHWMEIGHCLICSKGHLANECHWGSNHGAYVRLWQQAPPVQLNVILSISPQTLMSWQWQRSQKVKATVGWGMVGGSAMEMILDLSLTVPLVCQGVCSQAQGNTLSGRQAFWC